MKSKAFWIIGLLLILGVTVAASKGSTGMARSDCPGTIVCPMTGERICKDRCPAVDPERANCPGKIVCPLDGELVCRDECPLGETSEAATPEEGDVPACCQTANQSQ